MLWLGAIAGRNKIFIFIWKINVTIKIYIMLLIFCLFSLSPSWIFAFIAFTQIVWELKRIILRWKLYKKCHLISDSSFFEKKHAVKTCERKTTLWIPLQPPRCDEKIINSSHKLWIFFRIVFNLCSFILLHIHAREVDTAVTVLISSATCDAVIYTCFMFHLWFMPPHAIRPEKDCEKFIQKAVFAYICRKKLLAFNEFEKRMTGTEIKVNILIERFQ